MSSSTPKRSRRRNAEVAGASSSQSPSADAEPQDMLYFSTQAQADSYVLRKNVEKLQARMTRSRDRQIGAVHERIAALEAPVYRLSDEILVHIFTLGAEGAQDTEFADLVSHVVSRWRNVALATPVLWAAIRIDVTPKSLIPMNRLQALVERSSTCPLRLTVKLKARHTSYLNFARDMLDYVFDVLLPRCLSLECRDESLGLFVKPPAPSTTLRRLTVDRRAAMIRFLLSDQYPSLVELSIIGTRSELHRHGPIVVPSLRKLVWGVTFFENSDLIDVSFPCLESLEIRETLGSLLRSFFEGVWSSSTTQHQLPSLREVRFTSCIALDPSLLAQFIYSLPSLNQLVFKSCLIPPASSELDGLLNPQYFHWSPTSLVITLDSTFNEIPFLVHLRDVYAKSTKHDFKFGSVRIGESHPLEEADKLMLQTVAHEWEYVSGDIE